MTKQNKSAHSIAEKQINDFDDANQLRENDENIAKLLLQRTVNQAWKKRFAEMMESLDAKELVRAADNHF